MANLTVTEIRSAIAAALTGLVGTYTYSDGTTAAALWATDGPETRPEQPRVSGLEVIYSVEAGEMDYRRFLGLQYGVRRSGRIELRQWDAASTTRAALTALVPTLTRIPVRIEGNPTRLPRSPSLGTIETAVINFSYPSI